MDSLPEVEALLTRVDHNHVQHVKIEIELVNTFLELAAVELGTGNTEASRRSHFHARQALEGARRGLLRISAAHDISTLESRLSELQIAVDAFVSR